jgi:hypothetical protein
MAFSRVSKTKKWQIEAKPTWHQFGGKVNCFGPKKMKELIIWRTKMQARAQGKVQLKDSFASNESKLVPTNLDLGPTLDGASN